MRREAGRTDRRPGLLPGIGPRTRLRFIRSRQRKPLRAQKSGYWRCPADFDGGRLTSDDGVMLLSMAERRLGIADRLAYAFPDRRNPSRITHTLADLIRARVFAIACGYEDAVDLDRRRGDPAFKLACGRLPDSGNDLCSQPTLSRLENAPSLKDAIRLTYTLVDQLMASYEREPASVTLDIDDTCDVVHGHQQMCTHPA